MSLPLMGGMMNEPTHLEWSLPPKPSDNTNDVSIMEEAQPEQDKEDVLRAMLYVAEDEIRAKEVQVELIDFERGKEVFSMTGAEKLVKQGNWRVFMQAAARYSVLVRGGELSGCRPRIDGSPNTQRTACLASRQQAPAGQASGG